MKQPTQQLFTEDDLREMVLRLAHEIRNPLATIQSAAQLIEHIQQPQGETAEFFESIYIEVSRIDRVVRDMQRFVRLDVCTATAISVNLAVTQAVEAVRSRAQQREVSFEALEGETAIVLMDREQLAFAIEELLDNAVRFSPPSGIVDVSWQMEGNNLVVITIKDCGPGVEESEKDKILRPFYSSSTQGTGLGLNIVARTCQLAGGGLEWRNRDQGGACFSLRLPIFAGD